MVSCFNLLLITYKALNGLLKICLSRTYRPGSCDPQHRRNLLEVQLVNLHVVVGYLIGGIHFQSIFAEVSYYQSEIQH